MLYWIRFDETQQRIAAHLGLASSCARRRFSGSVFIGSPPCSLVMHRWWCTNALWLRARICGIYPDYGKLFLPQTGLESRSAWIERVFLSSNFLVRLSKHTISMCYQPSQPLVSLFPARNRNDLSKHFVNEWQNNWDTAELLSRFCYIDYLSSNQATTRSKTDMLRVFDFAVYVNRKQW